MAWHSAPPCATLPATLQCVYFVFTKETAVGTSGLESVAWGRTADDRYYLWKKSQGIHYYLTLHFVDKQLRLSPEKWSSPWSSIGVQLWGYTSHIYLCRSECYIQWNYVCFVAKLFLEKFSVSLKGKSKPDILCPHFNYCVFFMSAISHGWNNQFSGQEQMNS